MAFWGQYRRELDRLQRRRVLHTALLTVLLCATAFAGFWFGRHVQGVDQRRIAALEDMQRVSTEQQAGLRQELAGLRLEQSVSHQAGDELRGDLKQQGQELAALRDELVFYRSLMAPDRLAKGLQIAGFELFEKRSGGYTFHLLLTQVAQRRSRLSGKVSVQVSGVREGEAEVLPLTDLAELEAYPLPYRFRYFQDIKGEIRLPEGFRPETVQVSVQARGKQAVERDFPWGDSVVSRRTT